MVEKCSRMKPLYFMENNAMLLSIIVATFNASPYLKRFIKCLAPQIATCGERVEVVFVNDCSPDDSADIIASYQRHYPYVKLVNHTHNKGAAAARNTGIENSSGEYMMMVDPDDTLKPNALETLIPIMKKEKPDIIRYRFERFNKEDISLGLSPALHGNGFYLMDYSQSTLLVGFLDVAFHMGSPTGAFRRAAAPNIRQRVDHVIAEDLVFGWDFFKECKNFYCINEPLYNYYQYSNSVSHSIRDEKTVRGVLQMDSFFWREAKCFKNFNLVAKAVFQDLFRMVVGWHYQLVFKESKSIAALKRIYFDVLNVYLVGPGVISSLGLLYPIAKLTVAAKSYVLLIALIRLMHLRDSVRFHFAKIRKRRHWYA